MANSVDLDEVAHQDLCCLQIQIFSSLVLKEFKGIVSKGTKSDKHNLLLNADVI